MADIARTLCGDGPILTGELVTADRAGTAIGLDTRSRFWYVGGRGYKCAGRGCSTISLRTIRTEAGEGGEPDGESHTTGCDVLRRTAAEGPGKAFDESQSRLRLTP